MELQLLNDHLLPYGINLVFAFIAIRLIYFPKYNNRDSLFSFFVLNTVVFFICTFMHVLNLELGLAIGLFAIFGIIRYRTETIPIREMTYLFLVIGLALINALAFEGLGLRDLVIVNAILVVLPWLMEAMKPTQTAQVQTMNYDRADLCHQDQKEALFQDIFEKTGKRPSKVEVLEWDFLRDTAKLKVFF